GGGADRVPVLASLLDEVRVDASVLVVLNTERVEEPRERRGAGGVVAGRHVHGVGLDPAQEVGAQVALGGVLRIPHHPLRQLDRRDVPAVGVAGGQGLGGGAPGGQVAPVHVGREGGDVAGDEGAGLGLVHPEVVGGGLLPVRAARHVVDRRLAG